MGYTSDLLNGLAGELATAGIGIFHLDPTMTYNPAEVGIGIGDFPTGCDQAISLQDFTTSGDHPTQALSLIAVQFGFRGLPNDRDSMTDLRDATFQAIHGLTDRNYGVCHLIQILRRTGTGMGWDGNRRPEWVDDYYADVNPPATPNRNQ